MHPEAAQLVPSSLNTIKCWIIGYYRGQKSILRDLLPKLLSRILFTLALWTSPNPLASLALIVHFTTPSGTLTQALLALQEMQGSHSGKNICHTFISIMEDYNIHHRIGYFMMDNATNSDTFVHCQGEKQADSGVFLDAQEHRVR